VFSSTTVQGLVIAFRLKDPHHPNAPIALYVIVTLVVASVLLYGYLGAVKLEMNERQWLKDIKHPVVEKVFRIVILILLQGLVGVNAVVLNGTRPLSVSLVSTFTLFFLWDYLIGVLGWSSGDVEKTFWRFFPFDSPVLIASLIVLWGTEGQPSANKQVVVTVAAMAIVVCIAIFAGRDERCADTMVRSPKWVKYLLAIGMPLVMLALFRIAIRSFSL
jgi:hypothetical protein